MYSLSIDYLFNRIYDVLLWLKYVWLFVLLRKSPDDYLAAHTDREYDGLRDRGWFTDYLANKDAAVPQADVHASLWHRMLESLGFKVSDPNNPYDQNGLSEAQLKERYEADYSLMDHVREMFGIGPKDSDNDGVPDSYELKHNLNPDNPDTDYDGIPDGEELARGLNPLNPDTDGDLVLDGRDAYPLDGTRSVKEGDIDSDGDGIGDAYEKLLGTDPHKRDTDGDGIPDTMDTYPLDPENLSKIPSLDINQASQGLHLSVQNPALAFFISILSILTLFIVLVFAYAVFRWFISFISGLNHYEHHFGHGDDHGHGEYHEIEHASETHEELLAGIANLPVAEEETPASAPLPVDFEDHPRFAIVQGYLASNSEALWRIGILEADNMLEHVLRDKGYEGETVADMLKEANFKTVQLAWDAHAIRNRIAHQGSEFELTEREAKRAFTLYESVFRELKVIR